MIKRCSGLFLVSSNLANYCILKRLLVRRRLHMKRLKQVDEKVSDLLSFFFLFAFLIQFLILQVYNDFVGETHFDILVLLVFCLMVQLEVLLYLKFMILPLLLHSKDLFLTSLLGFLLLVAMLLLVLQIKKRLSVKFLVQLVLVQWMEKRMWCKLQILALIDLTNLDLQWIQKIHFRTPCLKKTT